MLDSKQEFSDLALVERQIVESERRVSRQAMLVERKRWAGQRTKLEEHILKQFEAARDALHRHRKFILDAIDRSSAK
ncbi:hypothetical protein [Microvirga massiliensis]|uniref:hypothetical protein n=1 Tax=Microvirga massiliensis TaxID=1033741 RepID=UPI00062BBF5A|nr:hypothetical protein [Microvirga massiliensis]